MVGRGRFQEGSGKEGVEKLEEKGEVLDNLVKTAKVGQLMIQNEPLAKLK